MEKRVHPNDSPIKMPSSPTAKTPPSQTPPPKPTLPPEDKPVPQPLPGTYVIQLPKDQIYRVPPPENAKLLERYTRRGKGSRQRSGFCCFLLTVVTLLSLAAAAAGLFYLIVKPKAPSYSVDGISISSVDFNSTAAMSPEIGVRIRAMNPNDKIKIYYVSGSTAALSYAEVKLATGVVPVMHQSTNSYTEFNVTLKGSDVVLSSDSRPELGAAQSQRSVPLTLMVKAPVKFRVGAIKTWKITVKLSCDLTVDELTASAKIIDENCDYGVNIL